MSVRHENVKWVDGLRGLASATVVFTHLTRAFDGDLFLPASEVGKSPRFFQYPILRLLTQGRIGVSIFALVTGYVCALKPIRQSRAGRPEDALTSIGKSAFRRVPRLFLPSAIITVIMWAMCELGMFEIAKHGESWWTATSSPARKPIFESIQSLVYEIVSTWTRGSNSFDNNQWTMLPLLKGSFLVYCMLVATVYVKPRYRMMVSLGLFVYYYICRDAAFGMQFFFGSFLSDLSQHPGHVNWMATHRWPTLIMSPILIFIGLWIGSYPGDKPENMPWSKSLYDASFYIFPEKPDIPRSYTGLGMVFLALGIHFSNPVKSFLSNKYFLWLGKNSFAVYLIHGTLIRTVLAWLYYGITVPADVINDKGEAVHGPALHLKSRLTFWFWLPPWFVLLYSISHCWTKYVDPFCARLTQRLEKYCFEDTTPEVSTKEHLSPLPR